jgi:tRNA U34 2-thiouridine synthase MnmA/TrmU
MMHEAIKAVCLVSGGLDSALAVRLMQEQGIRILAVNFVLPFLKTAAAGGGDVPARVARSLGIDLRSVHLGDGYLDIIRHPEHGYGKNINPCIDCHIHMLRKAKEIMVAEGASFVVTGEVVGQRPMSQRRDMLRRIEKRSGLEGLLLRPLSAKLLDPTIPESRGWVRRDDLLAISGRSRKELIRLAHQKGITGYSTPAGGCLLTDPGYALRVRDLMAHDMLTLRDVKRLAVGRHFRLPQGSKLIVGRNEADNEALTGMAGPGDTVLSTPYCPGPTAVLSGDGAEEEAGLAAGVVARYSDDRQKGLVSVLIVSKETERIEDVAPLDPGRVRELMI